MAKLHEKVRMFSSVEKWAIWDHFSNDEYIRNQRKDFLHKLSYQIANDNDLICIEDLNIKAMSRSLKFGKSVHDNGWGSFIRMLEYKLSDRGKHLVKVDRLFPSGKTCSCCGSQRDIKLSERVYTCLDCGAILDRDMNAAINIREEGRRIFIITAGRAETSFMLVSLDASSEKPHF